MNVSVYGMGYVGLPFSIWLARQGHLVYGVDVDEGKIRALKDKKCPIHEPGIEDHLALIEGKSFFPTTNEAQAVLDSEISFICVGTPLKSDLKNPDLSFIEDLSKKLGSALKEKQDYHVFVVKSTVVPGTTESIVTPLIEEYSGKKAGVDFGVCVNPEFLTEGNALRDTFNADRVVIGSADSKSRKVLEEVYSNEHCPVIKTDVKSAEMIKYACNSFLATRVSFANEIGGICKALGVNAYAVTKALKLDKRFGSSHLEAGSSYGGPCLVKDIRALISVSKQTGYTPSLLESVESVNNFQTTKTVDLIDKVSSNRLVSVFGLAFKRGTKDARNSPSINLVKELTRKGYTVRVHDSVQVLEDARLELKDSVEYSESINAALKDSTCCVITPSWPTTTEFLHSLKEMKEKNVVDVDNVLPAFLARQHDLKKHSIH